MRCVCITPISSQSTWLSPWDCRKPPALWLWLCRQFCARSLVCGQLLHVMLLRLYKSRAARVVPSTAGSATARANKSPCRRDICFTRHNACAHRSRHTVHCPHHSTAECVGFDADVVVLLLELQLAIHHFLLDYPDRPSLCCCVSVVVDFELNGFVCVGPCCVLTSVQPRPADCRDTGNAQANSAALSIDAFVLWCDCWGYFPSHEFHGLPCSLVVSHNDLTRDLTSDVPSCDVRNRVCIHVAVFEAIATFELDFRASRGFIESIWEEVTERAYALTQATNTIKTQTPNTTVCHCSANGFGFPFALSLRGPRL